MTSRAPPPSSHRPKERAAAVVIATLPGATMWHEGQFEGWRVRLPVFLGRRPAEPVDEELRRFHLGLIGAAAARRRGDWALCDASGWPDDSSSTQLLAWSWIDDEQRSLIVINFADAPAAARIHPPWNDLAERTWRLEDLLSDRMFERDGTEIATDGLYVQLAPWEFHVFAWNDAPGRATPDHRPIGSCSDVPDVQQRRDREHHPESSDVAHILGARHLTDARFRQGGTS